MDYLNDAFEKLLRDDGGTLQSYFHEIQLNSLIEDTKTTCHIHCLNLDGNGRPRVDALVAFLAYKVIDYAIPRKKIREAYKDYENTGSSRKMVKLTTEARKLFTTLAKSGEGGEFILFLFAEQFLKLPQIICKMSLKTSTQMHYHGADGIHIGVDSLTEKLCLYWGESKLFVSLSSAISECMESISPMLQGVMAMDGAESRDMQLLESHLNVEDRLLEEALKKYLDPDNPEFNQLEYRGICLVGFDIKDYPKEAGELKIEGLSELVNKKIKKWRASVKDGVSKKKLNQFSMHVFLLPFPSVSAFRSSLRKALKGDDFDA